MQVKIDKLIRSKRKTVALVVGEDGKLTVRAPLRLSKKAIDEFVQSKADWVRRNQEKAHRLRSERGVKRFAAGESYWFLGKQYALQIVERPKPELTLNGSFQLARLSQPKARLTFEDWYRREARRVLTEHAARIASQNGFTYARLRISSARTNWGSCSARGTLSFTYRLVMAPLEVIEYVVTHELVHTQVRNHSAEFWRRVAELSPDYKRHIRWLKDNGHRLGL
jgi:predicted metal-dependent hydrolase